MTSSCRDWRPTIETGFRSRWLDRSQKRADEFLGRGRRQQGDMSLLRPLTSGDADRREALRAGRCFSVAFPTYTAGCGLNGFARKESPASGAFVKWAVLGSNQ